MESPCHVGRAARFLRETGPPLAIPPSPTGPRVSPRSSPAKADAGQDGCDRGIAGNDRDAVLEVFAARARDGTAVAHLRPARPVAAETADQQVAVVAADNQMGSGPAQQDAVAAARLDDDLRAGGHGGRPAGGAPA